MTSLRCYKHFRGRTARAGLEGVAVSLVVQREEWRLPVIKSLLPDEMLQQREIPGVERSGDSLRPMITTIQIDGGRKKQVTTRRSVGRTDSGRWRAR